MAADNQTALDAQLGATAADDSHRTSSAAQGDVAALSLKLPQYWPQDPQVWLAQVNSRFAVARTTSQSQKFNHPVSALPPEIATKLRNLIVLPPPTTPFETLTRELIQRTTMSEQRRLQVLQSEELGVRKPSQLLRRIQQLLGEKEVTFDQALLRELFLQRLPNSVRMVLATARGLTIFQLAQLVDSIMDVSTRVERLVLNFSHPERSGPTQVAPTMPSSPALQSLPEEFRGEITKVSSDQIAALSAQRQHSPARPLFLRLPFAVAFKQGVCRYHRNFGQAARKCTASPPFQGNSPAHHQRR
ncbi:uncharacterized protein LOC144172966 [Haemaphysalis longicornis]